MTGTAMPRQQLREGLLLLPLLFVVVALLLVPLLTLLHSSFQGSQGLVVGQKGGGWTLANYTQFFLSAASRRALGNSLWISLGVSAFSTLLCLAPAWLLVRYEFRGKRWLRAFFTLPMAFSGIIIGFLTVIMLGRIGVVPRAIEALTGSDWFYGTAYGFGGILIAYLYFEIPRATMTLESAIQKLDPRWELAAASLGASPWQRFRFVTFPLVLPALLSTFAVTFSVSLGSFGVVLVISKRFSLTPIQIFEEVYALSNYEAAATMSVVLIVLGLIVNFLIRTLAARVLAHRA